jgi:hypothetical protein
MVPRIGGQEKATPGKSNQNLPAALDDQTVTTIERLTKL